MGSKRRDYIWMSIAQEEACYSNDPNTKVGAAIYNPLGTIISFGHNKYPNNSKDGSYSWERQGNYLDTKYPYVCHAEMNAIAKAHRDLSGCTIYTTLFPCNECAKLIIQSGITEVVYADDKYADTDSVKAAKIMFKNSGIITRQFVLPNE